MKTLRAEFRNHQLWNLDAPAQRPERLVFRDGSEVVITLQDGADLLTPDPDNMPHPVPTDPRTADAVRKAGFIKLALEALDDKKKFFEFRQILNREQRLYFTISAGVKKSADRTDRYEAYFEVELLEDLYLVRTKPAAKGDVAPCRCVVRAQVGNDLKFFEPVYAYSLNDAYSKTYVLYFSVFGKGTTNVYDSFRVEPRRNKAFALGELRQF